ncbi:protein kinase domain-containing protein [Blautia sp.]|jgi:hypothetical protein|uniref:protein kinase domain-containing protein n=1 Tax=Blautia sp. TaxID=1955243 RepID=UPI000E4DBF2D|nr:protein kinase [Blautia sp.]RHQ38043.1 hypothetical protein DWY50_04535 [Ruminococcus sp. AF25-28AC]RHT11089.1 hypothetical protein DW842_10505 [Ruminococcus sp. AM36-17]
MKENKIWNDYLPEDMQEHWTVYECLKESEDSSTFLVKETATGILCVLKWGRNRQAEFLRNEMEIMKKMADRKLSGIPKAYRIFEENGKVYLVREYIEGMSLAQMVLQKGGISEAEIYRISRKICQTAEQFQNPDEPMIHRDIKPENIVVTPGDEVVFIDFGTMRSYKKDGSRDTFVVGTRGTAAPEQYGYTQTDQRTDVYAIGQTMLYMVSESYEMNQLSECAVSRRMKKIIEKACSFEPDKRYGDAAQLRRAVEKCQANNRKKVYKKAGAVFGLIAAGYILAIFSQDGTVIENKRIETAEQSAAEEQIQAEITFREELIEEAVRKELGLSKTDKITASMLEDVRKLRIVGKEILDDEDTFWGEGHHVDGKDSSFGSVRGNITDLSDLAQMVNLEELALCNQKIEDISGLKELPLKKLYLSKNMITDFSVLLNLIDLDTLCIMENPAENLSVIGECTGILRLNIQGMNLTDIDFLKNLSLDYLDMSNVEVENNIFEPLSEMKKLDTLCMCDVNEAAAEILSQMSTLKALFMWGDSTILENLKPLKGMTQLETLAFTTQISSLEGIEQFPSLNFLSVSFSLVKDLSPVTGAKNLQVIDISNADIKNFEPLFGHSGLTEVHCTEEQKEEIMKIDSSPDFEIYT